MIIIVEDKSTDYPEGSIKLIPETNGEIFRLGILSGELVGKKGDFTYSEMSGAQMLLRLPIQYLPKAKRTEEILEPPLYDRKKALQSDKERSGKDIFKEE